MLCPSCGAPNGAERNRCVRCEAPLRRRAPTSSRRWSGPEAEPPPRPRRVRARDAEERRLGPDAPKETEIIDRTLAEPLPAFLRADTERESPQAPGPSLPAFLLEPDDGRTLDGPPVPRPTAPRGGSADADPDARTALRAPPLRPMRSLGVSDVPTRYPDDGPRRPLVHDLEMDGPGTEADITLPIGGRGAAGTGDPGRSTEQVLAEDLLGPRARTAPRDGPDEDDEEPSTVLQDPEAFAAAYAAARGPSLEPQPVYLDPPADISAEPELPSGARHPREERPEPTLLAPGELAGLPHAAEARAIRPMVPPEPIEATDPGVELRSTPLRSGTEPAEETLPESPGPDDTRPVSPVSVVTVAPLWRRLAGLAVDAALLVGLTIAATGALAPHGDRLPSRLEPDLWLLLVFEPAVLVEMGGIALVTVMMGGLMEGLVGWTPGKGVTGLRAARADGAPIGVGAGLARAALAPMSLGLLGAGMAWVLVDRRCRALHEHLTGTLTVRASGD